MEEEAKQNLGYLQTLSPMATSSIIVKCDTTISELKLKQIYGHQGPISKQLKGTSKPPFSKLEDTELKLFK